MKTVDYYNENITKLVDKYDSADMSQLHQLLLKYIPDNSTILDIGFGSGRDLDFLQSCGYDIWGIDPSVKFVENIKKRFPNIQKQFIETGIPFDKSSIGLNREFDVVVSIAMWMHLEHTQYADALESIVSVTKDNSTIVISYSEGNRIDDGRYFVEVNLKYLVELFNKNDFSLVETIKNGDSLDRDSLTWVTVVFKNDNAFTNI